jgi:hypothetical protein
MYNEASVLDRQGQRNSLSGAMLDDMTTQESRNNKYRSQSSLPLKFITRGTLQDMCSREHRGADQFIFDFDGSQSTECRGQITKKVDRVLRDHDRSVHGLTSLRPHPEDEDRCVKNIYTKSVLPTRSEALLFETLVDSGCGGPPTQ